MTIISDPEKVFKYHLTVYLFEILYLYGEKKK